MSLGIHSGQFRPPATGTSNATPRDLVAATPRRTTRALLAGGVAAGPLYLVVGMAQALTRPGFDITRHDLSLLANGALGWIQVANFIVSGLLVIGAALGLRRRTRGAVLPLLLGLYGLGLIGAGLFRADPAFGFPPGTPADAHSISGHGLLHVLCGGLGFLALIAACFVTARRCASRGHRGWALYSAATGVIFFAGFAGIAMGSGHSGFVLTFYGAVVVAWAWISAVCARLLAAPDVI